MFLSWKEQVNHFYRGIFLASVEVAQGGGGESRMERCQRAGSHWRGQMDDFYQVSHSGEGEKKDITGREEAPVLFCLLLRWAGKRLHCRWTGVIGEVGQSESQVPRRMRPVRRRGVT